MRLKLVSDPDVKGGALDVQVKDGMVTLRGAVTSDRGKQKAERLTKKVKGVHGVVNEAHHQGAIAPHAISNA